MFTRLSFLKKPYYKFHLEIITIFSFIGTFFFCYFLDGLITYPSDYKIGDLHSYIFTYWFIIAMAITCPLMPVLVGCSIGITLSEFAYSDNNYFILASFVIAVLIILSINFLQHIIHYDYFIVLIAVAMFFVGYLISWSAINNYQFNEWGIFFTSILFQSLLISVTVILVDSTLRLIAKYV